MRSLGDVESFSWNHQWISVILKNPTHVSLIFVFVCKVPDDLQKSQGISFFGHPRHRFLLLQSKKIHSSENSYLKKNRNDSNKFKYDN